MEANEIRKKFLDFFEKRGHAVVPSSSLIPDDPSVLLTTSGMQQFKPYFLSKADPMHDLGSRKAVSIQKSFRTSDIDEVGDESHLTFFEMLGHFSFGDYFKKETIEWTHELLTQIFKIDTERISATVFAGDEKIPFDQESYDAWTRFLPRERIRKGPRADNVWGPPGPEGPCGAANEVYVDDLEIATLVFMEYYCANDGDLTPLPQKGVDVGWGLERIAKVLQNATNIFETDLFAPLMELLPGEVVICHKRIIIDHLRASTFLLGDGVRPSNKEAGYILRRLLRRTFVYEKTYNISLHIFDAVIHDIVHEYGEFYPELLRENENIRNEFKNERERFNQVEEVTAEAEIVKKIIDKAKNETDRSLLLQLLTELRKEKRSKLPSDKIDKKRGVDVTPYQNLLDAYHLSGAEAFDIQQRTGVHLERIAQLARKYRILEIDESKFWKEAKEAFEKHQEISRAGVEKKFGGHGLILDTGELKAANEEELKKVTRLHTATHLLNSALQKTLGDEISQRGSDINAERTRFDFTFSRKLTAEEIMKIEELVNYAVKKDFPVTIQEMELEEAKKSGALFSFKGKYPTRVKVYTVGDKKETFSKELCGGPHVTHTGEIGKFKIIKEEASSAGIRRIRASVD
ncbi:MAG: alanine--tRNA ligase-related protein [bacterium]|nr:alanine--tRNA ligase-related protein [bacterium]